MEDVTRNGILRSRQLSNVSAGLMEVENILANVDAKDKWEGKAMVLLPRFEPVFLGSTNCLVYYLLQRKKPAGYSGGGMGGPGLKVCTSDVTGPMKMRSGMLSVVVGMLGTSC